MCGDPPDSRLECTWDKRCLLSPLQAVCTGGAVWRGGPGVRQDRHPDAQPVRPPPPLPVPGSRCRRRPASNWSTEPQCMRNTDTVPLAIWPAVPCTTCTPLLARSHQAPYASSSPSSISILIPATQAEPGQGGHRGCRRAQRGRRAAGGQPVGEVGERRRDRPGHGGGRRRRQEGEPPPTRPCSARPWPGFGTSTRSAAKGSPWTSAAVCSCCSAHICCRQLRVCAPGCSRIVFHLR